MKISLLMRFITLFIISILYGCHSEIRGEYTSKNQKDVATEKNKIISDSENASKNDISHLTQCNRDLESLHTVNKREYDHYQIEYDNLMKNSASFLTVKDDVSPEVAALARPRFQFALVNLCYRIKDALAQTLINQAGGR